MKLRKLAAALTLAGLAGLSSVANAFTIDGITIPVGATFSTITLFEGEKLGSGNSNSYIDQAGEVLLGIGLVNQILDINNNIVWQNGQNGRELTVVLDNFVADTPTLSVSIPDNEAIARIRFTGGTVKLYSQAVGTLQTGAPTQAAAVASASAGSLWLDLTGSPIGGFTGPGPSPITLSVRSITNSSGNPLLASTNVTGQGFLDVVGGAAGPSFDTNTLGCLAADPLPCPDNADIKFTSSGQLLPPGGPFGFRGTGEITAFTVPTPGSLALVGMALVAGGMVARRKNQAKIA